MKRNIALWLEYDGSAFQGFQKQPHSVTVQGSLEPAFKRILGASKIGAASGRTDAGVHAEDQVVNVHTDSSRSLNEIQKALNAILPDFVVIKKVKDVPENFNARFSAKGKIYRYTILNQPYRSPMQAKSAWHVVWPLNVALMKKAAQIIKGKHDFSSFCTLHSVNRDKDKVRIVKKISIKKEKNRIIFHLEANGFLYHMARNIVGLLVEVGKEKASLAKVRHILQAKDRREAPMAAPAHGLCLEKVFYERGI